MGIKDTIRIKITHQIWPTNEDCSFRGYKNYSKTRIKWLFSSGYSESHWKPIKLKKQKGGFICSQKAKIINEM